MGLRGFRVSLARTATKEDCIEVQFAASEIIVMLNTAPPPPSPHPEGRVTPLCGLYSGLPLDRVRFLVSVLGSKDENQQQTQPTYDTGTGNRTRATLVEGECSHHCAIP